MIRVYVAGPITKGDQMCNVARGIEVTNQLLDLGMAPFCPHLSAFLHMHQDRAYEGWLAYDRVWLGQCQCLLRIPGESVGADREMQWAVQMGLPVFLSVEELVRHYRGGVGKSEG